MGRTVGEGFMREPELKGAQDAFDYMVNHLRKQGRSSEKILDGGPTCLYRHPDGLKCAVGCLIDDQHYSKSLELKGSTHEDVFNALSESGWDVDEMLDLLNDMQGLHDNLPPDEWETEFIGLARVHGLKLPPKENAMTDPELLDEITRIASPFFHGSATKAELRVEMLVALQHHYRNHLISPKQIEEILDKNIEALVEIIEARCP